MVRTFLDKAGSSLSLQKESCGLQMGQQAPSFFSFIKCIGHCSICLQAICWHTVGRESHFPRTASKVHATFDLQSPISSIPQQIPGSKSSSSQAFVLDFVPWAPKMAAQGIAKRKATATRVIFHNEDFTITSK